MKSQTTAGQPLSLQATKQYTYMYTELDCVGNVRHLHTDGNDHRNPQGDLGGYSYSAFGKLLLGTDPGALSGGAPLFGWQGKRVLSVLQPNLYDSRARVWSADLGTFLQPDEYVFLTRSGTLWSWPGSNDDGFDTDVSRSVQNLADLPRKRFRRDGFL